jgi:hypothetical protein
MSGSGTGTMSGSGTGTTSGSGTGTTTSAAGATGDPVCGPRGAHTLAANGHGRVYAVGSSIYACSLHPRRHYLLGHKSCLGHGHGIGPVALHGSDLAFGERSCGVDTITSTIQAQPLSGGAAWYSLSAHSGVGKPESFTQVTAIVLGANRAVAWISSTGSIMSHGRVVQVQVHDRRGQRTLDAAASIAPDSLRLHGATLHWRHGSTQRSAPL